MEKKRIRATLSLTDEQLKQLLTIEKSVARAINKILWEALDDSEFTKKYKD